MNYWMHPKITVGPAHQKGVGLFANGLISKDEIVGIYGCAIIENKRFNEPRYKSYDQYCFQIEQDFQSFPLEEKPSGIFLVNHSCNPTCGFRGQITLVAIRDILSGEEITYDYAMSDSNGPNIICPEMKCFCGSPDCRDVITGDDWRRPELWKRYQGYFMPYLQQQINQLQQNPQKKS